MKTNFSSETLEDMRCRLPEYLTAIGVELRRQGGRLVGKCPVHEDSSPSFAVYGAKLENAGCYPCGFSGDAFSVSQWLGRATTFPEAVQDVAATLGVHISSQPAGTATRPATPPQRPAKQPEPPFELCAADREKIRAARLAWSDDPRQRVGEDLWKGGGMNAAAFSLAAAALLRCVIAAWHRHPHSNRAELARV